MPHDPPRDPPAQAAEHERGRVRAAVAAARRRYPGPLGRVLTRELDAWQEFGWRFGRDSDIAALVTELLKEPPQ